MTDALAHLNWLSIALATLACYLLGALWFTPLFGKAWDASLGFRRTKNQRFTVSYYVVPLICSLLVAVATAVLADALGLQHLADALLLGGIVGIGYAASASLNGAITPNNPRPFLFAAVTGGYHIAGSIIVSVIIVAMR
ncbi:hypothetical protein BJG92_02217 [Arthrobacter sp. SO5]|uniref:DUF1761 domain-containing protein n=1 Tax=Arthrobacter sp. SO5 TaxID=1897055 RepID=UPI001E369BA6|nr:DUF1761 domain-containing protein [Arthrobacter sp. SO5]MCB5274680.1 hypothetical protein [Arthrobacter sp. SO5]